ncbi:Trm112 family protein [Pseudidiomarina taiwanensis]|uniref:UPF0434 protein CWI83_01155 n=1 Tax=Pseudidiomarina taiwanensis TaxID=337250 RepID=A0A432ZMN4_9GAMM|nr:Trm112 family protein [Pseudidiomarina taiwanensis]RUO79149.1 hypothetical protein CWI83_01155 [Pseudidiomarina taiwanensis]
MSIEPELLAILACPQCKGKLVYLKQAEPAALICRGCQLSFPVENDIPQLILTAATELSRAELEQLPS